MRAADHLVDLGPGAGEHGGHVVAQGTPEEVDARSRSRSPASSSPARAQIAVPEKRRRPSGYIEIEGAAQHNLQGHRREGPAGRVLLRHRRVGLGQVDARQRGALQGGRQPAAPGQAAPGRAQARSTGSTRSTRSSTSTSRRSGARRAPTRPPTRACSTTSASCTRARQEARARGYKPGRFSFNVKGGRCEVCRGDGQIKIEMHFLPDVYVPCEQCHGKRYNRETLEVRFKGKTIADVLDMTVEEALEFFKHIPKIKRRLQALHDVGLDYIRLGQPATHAVRRRGAAGKAGVRAVSKVATGATLYILDEPTTGLHFADVAAAAGGARAAGGRGQHRGRDRAQPRRDQDGRPDHRPRPRGRRGGRRAGRAGHARAGGGGRASSYTGRVPGAEASWPSAAAKGRGGEGVGRPRL